MGGDGGCQGEAWALGRNLEPTQPWPGCVTLGNSLSLSEPLRHGHSPLGQGGSLGDSSPTLHVVYQKKQVWVTLQFRNSPEQNPWPLQDGVLLPSPYSLRSDPAPHSGSWDVWGAFPPRSLHCVFSACKSLAPDLPMAVSLSFFRSWLKCLLLSRSFCDHSTQSSSSLLFSLKRFLWTYREKCTLH